MTRTHQLMTINILKNPLPLSVRCNFSPFLGLPVNLSMQRESKNADYVEERSFIKIISSACKHTDYVLLIFHNNVVGLCKWKHKLITELF